MSDRGLLCDPVADKALAQAMGAVRSRHFDFTRIVKHALRFSWERGAHNFVRTVCSRGSDGGTRDLPVKMVRVRAKSQLSAELSGRPDANQSRNHGGVIDRKPDNDAQHERMS
jgi:hypothetical protein